MDRPPVGNDREKKALRNMVEIGSKLSRSSKGARRLGDLFSHQNEKLISKLWEEGQYILFSPCGGERSLNSKSQVAVGTVSVDQLRRTEDMLWQKSVHDFVSLYKKVKNPNLDEVTLLHSSLMRNMGIYHSLLIRLATNYGVDVRKISPFLMADTFAFSSVRSVTEDKLLNWDSAEEVPRQYIEPEYIHWCEKCIHRVIIYLGDISRYLHALRALPSNQLAAQFYEAAVLWDPSVGMPFNQLGTLSGTAHYGLDAVYNYLRCLLAEKPFTGSEVNLKRILASNEGVIKPLREMYKEGKMKDKRDPVLVMKHFICEFMSLINSFSFVDQISSEHQLRDQIVELVRKGEKTIDDKVRSVFNSLQAALSLPAKLGTIAKPSHLTPQICFQVVVISISFIFKLDEISKQLDEGDSIFSSIKSTSVAFLLELTHNLIKATCERVADSDRGNSSPMTQSSNKTTEMSDENSLPKKDHLAPPRNHHHHHQAHLSSEIEMLAEGNLSSDLSELEETALKAIDSLNLDDDNPESDSKFNDSFSDTDSLVSDDGPLPPAAREDVTKGSSATAHDSAQHPINNSPSFIDPKSKLDRTMSTLYTQTFLPSIKLCCNWLSTNMDLVQFCSRAFPALFSELSNLLNLIIRLEREYLLLNGEFAKTWTKSHILSRKIPSLTSDLAVLGFKPLQLKIYDPLETTELNNIQQGFYCVESLIQFGHHIARDPFTQALFYHQATQEFTTTPPLLPEMISSHFEAVDPLPLGSMLHNPPVPPPPPPLMFLPFEEQQQIHTNGSLNFFGGEAVQPPPLFGLENPRLFGTGFIS